MLILSTTSDILRVVTDSSATLDVHASWVDRNGSKDTPGSTNTAIASVTTTTVVAAPAGSTYRNVRRLVIRNRSAATTCTVTLQLFNGTTAFELDKRALGPGQSLMFDDAFGFFPPSTGGSPARPWHGVVMGAFGDGCPGKQMYQVQRAGWIGPTPTNISTSVARCSLFIPEADITVNRIRYFGLGTTTNVYRCALYRLSDRARLTAELSFTTAADTWGSAGSALNVSLLKNTAYFIACSVNATSTTQGIAAYTGTTTATTGRVLTAPGSLPGSLALGGTAYLDSFLFHFAVSTGALPAPAATLAAPAAWTGGMPAFWLDSADV
jgi:hypothetical protein